MEVTVVNFQQDIEAYLFLISKISKMFSVSISMVKDSTYEKLKITAVYGESLNLTRTKNYLVALLCPQDALCQIFDFDPVHNVTVMQNVESIEGYTGAFIKGEDGSLFIYGTTNEVITSALSFLEELVFNLGNLHVFSEDPFQISPIENVTSSNVNNVENSIIFPKDILNSIENNISDLNEGVVEENTTGSKELIGIVDTSLDLNDSACYISLLENFNVNLSPSEFSKEEQSKKSNDELMEVECGEESVPLIEISHTSNQSIHTLEVIDLLSSDNEEKKKNTKKDKNRKKKKNASRMEADQNEVSVSSNIIQENLIADTGGSKGTNHTASSSLQPTSKNNSIEKLKKSGNSKKRNKKDSNGFRNLLTNQNIITNQQNDKNESKNPSKNIRKNRSTSKNKDSTNIQLTNSNLQKNKPQESTIISATHSKPPHYHTNPADNDYNHATNIHADSARGALTFPTASDQALSSNNNHHNVPFNYNVKNYVLNVKNNVPNINNNFLNPNINNTAPFPNQVPSTSKNQDHSMFKCPLINATIRQNINYNILNFNNNTFLGTNRPPIYNRPCPNYNPKLRTIIVDGSNVAMQHGLNQTFSCKGIKIVVDYFACRGHKVTVFVPQWRRSTLNHEIPHTNLDILEQLFNVGQLAFTPSRRVGNKMITSYDDRYILKLANDENGVVISNDQYQDLYVEQCFRETIHKRLLQVTFIGDKVMFPDDPLGRDGPNLDQFLTKDWNMRMLRNPLPKSDPKFPRSRSKNFRR